MTNEDVKIVLKVSYDLEQLEKLFKKIDEGKFKFSTSSKADEHIMMNLFLEKLEEKESSLEKELEKYPKDIIIKLKEYSTMVSELDAILDMDPQDFSMSMEDEVAPNDDQKIVILSQIKSEAEIKRAQYQKMIYEL